MSSPDERDGRFYGYNQDPYTRNPHVDPYTGYAREDRESATRAYEALPIETPITHSYSDLPVAKKDRSPVDIGVNLPMFTGGVIASAVIAALAAYLLCDVVLGGIYGRISDAYWLQHSIIPAPDPQTAATVFGTIVGVLIAAAVFVLLINTTPAPRTFFMALGVLTVLVILLASGLVDLINGTEPWQSTLGPVVVRLIVGWVAVVLVATTGRLTATRRARQY